MKIIEIFSDGSGTVVNNSGGYGWVMVVDGIPFSEGSGHMESATNNDAELMAALQGLIAVYKYLNANPNGLQEADVTLVSDSQIVLGWVSGRCRFKQIDKIENFKKIQALVKKMNVKTKWCKGHSGNLFNERCDRLAHAARLQIPVDQPKDKKAPKTRIGLRTDGVVTISVDGQIFVLDKNKKIVEDYSESFHGNREIRTV